MYMQSIPVGEGVGGGGTVLGCTVAFNSENTRNLNHGRVGSAIVHARHLMLSSKSPSLSVDPQNLLLYI